MNEDKLKKYMCEAITRLEDKERLLEAILQTKSQLLKLVDKCSKERNDGDSVKCTILTIMNMEAEAYADIKAIKEVMVDLACGKFPDGEEDYKGYRIVVYESGSAKVYSFCDGSFCALEYEGDSVEDCRAFIDRKITECAEQIMHMVKQ